MLKIYELLIRHPFKEFIIEELLEQSDVGRTSGFKAIKWLEDNGIITIKNVGKQRNVKLLIDENTLNFKFFLDSIIFKQVPKRIKFPVSLFSYLVSRRVEISSIILFGSALSESEPNDIDLLIAYKEGVNKRTILRIRDLVEKVSGFEINTHFASNPPPTDLFKGITIYSNNKFHSLLKNKVNYQKSKFEFKEIVERLNALLNNINDKSLVGELTKELILKLAYFYCKLNNIGTSTKEETINIFLKKYKDNLKNINKLENMKKFEALKEIVNGLGKEIFI